MPSEDSAPRPAEAIFRRKTVAASEGLLRVLRKAVECYGDDLDCFVIYLAVAMASTGWTQRRPDILASVPPAATLPDELHRPVSRRAIAASTGLPRESVRRKIAQLVEMGYLVEEPRGVRTRSGVILERSNTEFAATLIREVERTATELARLDAAAEPGG